jgi:hypothetical protein
MKTVVSIVQSIFLIYSVMAIIINCVGIVWIHWVFHCTPERKIRCTEAFWSLCILLLLTSGMVWKLQLPTKWNRLGQNLSLCWTSQCEHKCLSLHYKIVKWLTGWWKNKTLFEYWFILLLNFYHLWGQQTAIIYLCLWWGSHYNHSSNSVTFMKQVYVGLFVLWDSTCTGR